MDDATLVAETSSALDVALARLGGAERMALAEMLEATPPADASPRALRAVHHLACTGGTLIAKCLAATPNTLLLNEADPLSQIPFRSGAAHFAPTDLVSLIRQGDPAIANDLLDATFAGGLDVLLERLRRQGRRLIVRDHAHSRYTDGTPGTTDESFRASLATRFDLRSIVTVRHPLDSYLSLIDNGWAGGLGSSPFETYCERYDAFLDHHDHLPLFRYEDFVAAPRRVAAQMSDALDLPPAPAFEDKLAAFSFSGDSGRQSDTIEPRPRRAVPDAVQTDVEATDRYAGLLARMGYEA